MNRDGVRSRYEVCAQEIEEQEVDQDPGCGMVYALGTVEGFRYVEQWRGYE